MKIELNKIINNVFGVVLLGCYTTTVTAESLPVNLLGGGPWNITAPGAFVTVGEVALGNTTVELKAISETNLPADSEPIASISKSGLWAIDGTTAGTKIDNDAFTQLFNCSIQTLRLQTHKISSGGRGFVRLDANFDTPVSDLKLMIFDLEEGEQGNREDVLITAYDANNELIDAKHWRQIAQGDLTRDYAIATTSNPDPYLVMPTVLAPSGPRLTIQARNGANDNRDFTVLELNQTQGLQALKRLRVKFKGTRNNGHAYVSLWRGDLVECVQ